MDDETTLNVYGLERLLMALKTSAVPKARVGILGVKNAPHYAEAKNGRSVPKNIPTNAEVGAVHEFGSPSRGIPQRSFLRTPISENLTKDLVLSGALDPAVMADVIKEGTVTPWLKKVALTAEKIVLGAFSSNGYGKWPAWKTPGYQNNTGQILVDTTQLRNSITSEVKE